MSCPQFHGSLAGLCCTFAGMIRTGLLAVLIMVAGASCRRETASLKEGSYTAADSALHREWKEVNFRMVDTLTAQLQTGDIALRTGADATSHMLRRMNQKAQTYSHCGIVVIESGVPFVYHSIGGEDNPNAQMRRETALRFFHPLSNEGGGLYRLLLLPAEKEKLVATVQQWYREGRGFDMDFDLATDTQLYCAEMVYKAFQSACRQKPPFTQSKVGGFTYVAVDDLYGSGAGKLIWQFQFR